ncbi:hypothetical protein G5V57_01975 [Nordella sp. HKS 07]|uniref:hypothetical protein n=1 Tax=Nordella sp. HKS 07 TaxID=2712222 RepID=UPI0013E1111E|nr:hypothetical protein [Nordella sp. HKS 07]QIG46633.1 hypothetical protein G5V57_01975 [Nordella sp. HKS 07]
MILGLRIIREIVQALLRVWNKKDEGNRNGKPALAGDGAASQSPGTPSQLAKVQTIHGGPLNAAGLCAVERTTQLVFGGTGTHQRAGNTNKGSSDPGAHIKKAPHPKKQLPEIRCKKYSEVIGKGGQSKSAGRCRHVKLRKRVGCPDTKKHIPAFRKNPALRIDHVYELGVIQPKLIVL